jgi:phosphohistidine phosphatase
MGSSAHSLILLRHAKSDWSGGEVDLLRPLGARGRRQAPEAGRWLDANVGRIDLAIVSPAARARETWELASAELAVPPPTRVDDRVYAASCDELLEVVRGVAEEVTILLVVGHNPGIEDLASMLSGRPVGMPTSSLAVLTVAASWSAAEPSAVTLRTSGRPPEDYAPSG